MVKKTRYTISQNVEVANADELAVRLGAISLFERRGEIMWQDDFECSTLKWIQDVGTVARSTTSARNGNASLKLTTGASVDNLARAIWRGHYPNTYGGIAPYYEGHTCRIGAEFSFALGPSIKYIMLQLGLVVDSTHFYQGIVRYRPQDNDLQIYQRTGTPPAAWETIATSLDIYEQDKMYHTWKLVIDISNWKYLRLYLDDNEYDISSYGINYSTPSNARRRTVVDLEISNNASGAHYAYIDDFILTINEEAT